MANWIKVHPLVVRITHWINALAILVMVASGWRIYNASPLFESFTFPDALTLGGWLAGALQWHFAAMWLLALNGLVYVVYGIVSGHFRRRLLPISPGAILRDVSRALRGRLAHEDLSVYNAAQRAAYFVLILALVVMILSGLAIWKPARPSALSVFGVTSAVESFAGSPLADGAANPVITSLSIVTNSAGASASGSPAKNGWAIGSGW